MDLLYAMRDLGVADPAADGTGEETVRAALAQEIDKATVAAVEGRVGPGGRVQFGAGLLDLRERRPYGVSSKSRARRRFRAAL
jgi:hypothetical protein